jgi:hypothetical protein
LDYAKKEIMAKLTKIKTLLPKGYQKGTYGEKGDWANDGGFTKGKDWKYGPEVPGSHDKLSGGREKEVKKDDDETGYEHMNEDHKKEGKMAKHDAMECASDAKDVANMIQDEMNLPEWLEAKITLAADYMNSVKDYISHHMMMENINEGKKVTQNMWDKDWRITKKYGKEFDDNLAKRIKAAMSVARNEDQAENWAFKNWKQLPTGALKMTLDESFSDNSPEAKERIKKTSQVLGMELVGELEEPSFNLREAKLVKFFNEYIRKQGEKWVVQSKAGKTLGTHDTKKAAIKQLAAIEASKAKKS